MMYSEYLLALFHAELFQISYRNLLLYIPWLCLRFAFWLEFKINLIALNTFLILVVTLPFHHCCHHTKWRIKDDVPMLYTVSDLFIFFATLEARHVYSGFMRVAAFWNALQASCACTPLYCPCAFCLGFTTF
jgi:hypothetical protein